MVEVFERKSIRMFSDADQEVDQIQQMLDTICEKLKVPYAAIQSETTTKNEVQQLNDALQEISGKESELRQLSEVTQLLLTKNKESIGKCNTLIESYDYLAHQNVLKARENSVLKQSVERLEAQLAETTEQNTQLSYQRQILTQENQQLRIDVDSLKKSETVNGRISITNLQEEYTSSILTLKTSLEKSQAQLAEVRVDKTRLHDQVEELQAANEHLTNRNRSLVSVNGDLETSVSKLKDRLREELEHQKHLQFDLNSVKRLNEKLKKDLRMVRASVTKGKPPRATICTEESVDESSTPKKTTSVDYRISLLRELEEAGAEEMTSPSPEPTSARSAYLCLTPPRSLRSIGKSSSSPFLLRRQLEMSGTIVHHHAVPNQPDSDMESVDSDFHFVDECLDSTVDIDNDAQPAPEVSEEYFNLACLSVKLNSPYMDAICSTSNRKLYKEAMKHQIPFHKWHMWIDDYLTEQYITSVCRTPVNAD